ncbi:transglutaminase family protein [Viridibacterium curvum]|uniref:Transglutaminase family protein n=1 Tax=Viridibacterium curvum TaxID=1101404 RepID=A0ABP9Q701_9RHOO
MARYHIEHVTHYSYSQTVGLSLQLAHLRPREDDAQRTVGHALHVSPQPAEIREDTDYFGNPVTRFELARAHQELIITAESEVTVERNASLPETSQPWEDVRAHFARTIWGLGLDADVAEFLFPSPHVPQSASARLYALESFTPERPVVEATADLMARIHADFEFDPDATHVATPIDTVLEIRRGVCQDFAHLMIACLRSLGLPARYVSGYLLTEPPPGQERLIGADASHAWVSLHVPEHGWLDFDPTNDMVPGNSHVTLAWGRDFTDVSPLRGVIQGGGDHTVKVGVTMTPIDPDYPESKVPQTATPRR